MSHFVIVAVTCFLTVCSYEFGNIGVTRDQLLLISINFAIWGIFYWLASDKNE